MCDQSAPCDDSSDSDNNAESGKKKPAKPVIVVTQ